MLLVILGHCIYFCIYDEHMQGDPAFSIICTFHVPLFFFLSGFVIKLPPTLPKFLGKACRFLVPMLVVGLINALLIGRVSDFFLNGGHNGYWYLLTLTLFYLLLVAFQSTEKLKGVRGFLADAGLAFALWLLITFANKPCFEFLSPLNPWGAFAFWPFFIMGYIIRKHELSDYILGRPWLTTLLLLAYLILLTASFSRIQALPLVIDFALATLAIAALMALFHAFSQRTTFLDRQLLLIGNETLNIYIYHYFFIRFIPLGFLREQILFVELAVIVPLTVAIAYASVGIGKIVALCNDNLFPER